MPAAMKKQPKEKLKAPLLVVVTISFVLVLLIFIAGTYHMLQSHLRHMVHQKVNSVSELLESEIGRQSDSLASLIQPFLVDEVLRQQFLTRDRTNLLRNSQSKFNQMFATNQVTHFYYHTPEKVNFLRVHAPQKHSDVINRYTLLKAEETGMPSSGFELGTLGTFTLRMVRPWYSEGGLIGYIELGKEIDSTVKYLSDIL